MRDLTGTAAKAPRGTVLAPTTEKVHGSRVVRESGVPEEVHRVQNPVHEPRAAAQCLATKPADAGSRWSSRACLGSRSEGQGTYLASSET